MRLLEAQFCGGPESSLIAALSKFVPNPVRRGEFGGSAGSSGLLDQVGDCVNHRLVAGQRKRVWGLDAEFFRMLRDCNSEWHWTLALKGYAFDPLWTRPSTTYYRKNSRLFQNKMRANAKNHGSPDRLKACA